MTAVADPVEFLRVLEKSGLIAEDKLGELRASGSLPESPSELAEVLVQRGWLTRYQAKQLLAGRHRGFLLGPYRVLDQLGQGGMGTVFLGEHADLGRKVAVKVLSRDKAADKVAVERFSREARATAALDHPNVVRLYDVGTSNGLHFLAVEYVDGATLDTLVDRRGPLPYEVAVHYAVQAARGLGHAHDKGFVHRDIKPENLMVTRDGVIKVLDMGLTRQFGGGEDKLTAIMGAGVVLGSIDYLPPEQAVGEPTDARSDLYSLGATLFYLISGHAPFDGLPPQQKLIQHQFGGVPRLDSHADVPDGLAAVVAKMMAKKKEDRYQSAAEVLDALAPWVPDEVEGPGSVVMSVTERAGPKSGTTGGNDGRSTIMAAADLRAGDTAPIAQVKTTPNRIPAPVPQAVSAPGRPLRPAAPAPDVRTPAPAAVNPPTPGKAATVVGRVEAKAAPGGGGKIWVAVGAVVGLLTVVGLAAVFAL